MRALEAVGEEGRDELLSDLKAVFARYNRGKDGSAIVENQYLRTIASRS